MNATRGVQLVGVLAIAAACGSNPPRTADPHRRVIEEACTRLFDAERQEAIRCGFGSAAPFATPGRPLAIRACTLLAGAAGSGESPESLMSCARTCAAPVMTRPATCGQARGQRYPGATCALDAQCTSGFCAREATPMGAPSTCGRCMERARENALCGSAATPNDLPCGENLTCLMGRCTSRTANPRRLDEPCNETRTEGRTTFVHEMPCQAGLICAHSRDRDPVCSRAPSAGDPCLRGLCAAGHICVDDRCKAPPGLGDPCLPNGRCPLFLRCEPGSTRCVARPVVGEGGLCGADAECGDGLQCGATQRGAPPSCRADLGEGAPCTVGGHPACGFYLVCSSGRCAVEDPARCD